MSDKNSKVGKKHDKKNCPYCKNHKKHPNGCEGKKQSAKKEANVEKKESVGLVPKMVKIARGILFDVCAHAHDGDGFAYYVTDLARGKWNHLVVNGKNEEKDAERKADVIWSYDEGKFVKDKNGVMEISTLFNSDAERIQSRFEKKDGEECDLHGVGYDNDIEDDDDGEEDEEEVVSRCVKSFTIDTSKGTFTDNITGVVKKVEEMTDEERKIVGFAACQKPTQEKPTAEKSASCKPTAEKPPCENKQAEQNAQCGGDVIDKAIEVAHRLKDERDAARAELAKVKCAYEGLKAILTAKEKAAELKKLCGEDDCGRRGFFVSLLKRVVVCFGIGILLGAAIAGIVHFATKFFA